MVIYKRDRDNIEIYNLYAKEEEIKRYRRVIINKFAYSNQVLHLVTNSKTPIIKLGVSNDVDISALNYTNNECGVKNIYSSLGRVSRNEYNEAYKQRELLDKYIIGTYKSYNPIRIYDFIWEEDYECDRYYVILTESEKEHIDGNNVVYTVDNIINLPKQVYLLQLLSLGQFNRVMYEDIEEQLELFDLQYEKTLNLKEIKDMINYGLVDGSVDKIVEKADIGSKILSKRLHK